MNQPFTSARFYNIAADQRGEFTGNAMANLVQMLLMDIIYGAAGEQGVDPGSIRVDSHAVTMFTDGATGEDVVLVHVIGHVESAVQIAKSNIIMPVGVGGVHVS